MHTPPPPPPTHLICTTHYTYTHQGSFFLKLIQSQFTELQCTQRYRSACHVPGAAQLTDATISDWRNCRAVADLISEETSESGIKLRISCSISGTKCMHSNCEDLASLTIFLAFSSCPFLSSISDWI